jgi:hypothetical protein
VSGTIYSYTNELSSDEDFNKKKQRSQYYDQLINSVRYNIANLYALNVGAVYCIKQAIRNKGRDRLQNSLSEGFQHPTFIGAQIIQTKH